jgi:hypothetical protein
LKRWPYKNQADRDFVVGALRKAGLKWKKGRHYILWSLFEPQKWRLLAKV